MREFKNLVEAQHSFFNTGETLSVAVRKQALIKLRDCIIKNEEKIANALKSDLNKSQFESYMAEIGMVLAELNFMLKNISKWAKKKSVPTPLAQFSAVSYTIKQPYGVVLVMSPWNYPFMLSMAPVVGAIAAGNTVVLKPSAYAKNTAQIISDIISECFDEKFVSVVLGGREENALLLCEKWDYIFFTGGVTVGKLVLEKAAQNITPVTLELGGKSPCIVGKTANLKRAAARIAFGKFLNAGQTCVAPDYLLVHSSVKEEFLKLLKAEIISQYTANALENENYPKIINARHLERLKGLIQTQKLYMGGNSNTEKLEPTVLDNVQPQDAVMQEEIFGPILPVLTYNDFDEVVQFVTSHDKPLACYLFTADKAEEKIYNHKLSFGGGCINDTIIHLATSRMGFGGVGASGMGSYHGKYSFNTFSHEKSIVKKHNFIDLNIRYQPQNSTKFSLLKWFLK